MCGFLTEFAFEHSNLSILDDFEALLKLSKHRGPDDTKILTVDNYRFGFNRLAILDISKNGSQPKISPSKRYTIVFNGEIFNFKKLATDYKLINLKSSSDTEVLCHLLDAIGIDKTLDVIEGMFAISIIDNKDNLCCLIRDFAGIKPLFYGINNSGIVAASQFDQVIHHSWFKDELQLRPEIMKTYFALGYMHAPDTVYENIHQVMPGGYISINKEGVITKRKYKIFNFKKHQPGKNKNDNNRADLALISAIKNQLVSDVPIASFLSGGVDSPLVTAIAKKQKSDIEAFTMSVESGEMDESQMAKTYADHIGIKHNIQKIQQSTIIQEIEKHFKYLPEPFGDYSSIPTYTITKLASKSHTVMLSGDGGDELFFGYPRMLKIMKLRNWYKIPHMFRKPIIRIAYKLKLINSYGPYQFKNIEDHVLNMHSHIKENEIKKWFPLVEFSKEIKTLYSKKSNIKLLQWLRLNEFYGHLQRVLIKVDRMSMANSLEVRVPFLDKSVIESAFRIHPKRFKTEFDLKANLKCYLNKYFTKEIINNEKKGFTVPLEDWLRNELKKDVLRTIFESPIYGSKEFEFERMRDYVRDFYDKKHANVWGIWHIYAWQKWALNQNLI